MIYPTKWSWSLADPKFQPERVGVWVEDKSQALVPWAKIQSKLITGHSSDDLTGVVDLDVFTVSIRFEWVEKPPQHSFDSALNPPYRSGFYVRCHEKYATYSPLYLSRPFNTNRHDFTSKSWECVVLAQLAYKHIVTEINYRYEQFKDQCLLVIERNEGGKSAERVGFVNLGHRIWDDECEKLRRRNPDEFLVPLSLKKMKRKVRLV